MLGTTQVLSVPTQAERQGVDTTAFPGDTLYVPVNPQMAPILAAYPLPNDPQGSFGPRTYATSSKVATDTNQFSVRIDHRISDQGQLFVRFNLDNVNGPLTNPDQSAIDPSFAVYFHDHQRNLALNYTRTVSPHFTSETSLGYIRSTPLFLSPNHTQPAMTFADSLYEPFNSAAGTATGSYGNLYQFRQNFIYAHGTHTLKFGVEIRFNRDSTIFGVNPDGTYTFGGGAAYAPADIPSASGQHDIQAGDPLPDTLTGFLTATPFSYNTVVASAFTATRRCTLTRPTSAARLTTFTSRTPGRSRRDSRSLWPALRSEQPHSRRRRRTSTFRNGGSERQVGARLGNRSPADCAAQSAAALWAGPARVGAADLGGVAGHGPHGAARGRRNHHHPPQPLAR